MIKFNSINPINLLKTSTVGLRFQYKEPMAKKALEKNQILKGAYKGKRCFIIGTGPSINKQDLSLIAGETCLVMNSFYLHPEYPNLQDVYHVVTGIYIQYLQANSQLKNGGDVLTDGSYVDQWFDKFKDKLSLQNTKNKRFFVDFPDKEIVEKHLSGPEYQIFYGRFARNIEDIKIYGIDASFPLYNYHNVSVKALQLAIHMGFDQIYLLGLDHDWLVRRVAKIANDHFYDQNETDSDFDPFISWQWKDEFFLHYRLWQEYTLIGEFCAENNISIYNSTEGGLLDVFPRVRLSSIFN